MLPRRVEDRSRLRPIYELQHGAVETVQGTIGAVRQFRPRGRRGLVITRAAVTDGSGVLHAVWYNQPYLARHLTRGRAVVLHGRVARRSGEIQMAAPEFELVDDGEETLHVGRIVPVYRSTSGLSQRVLRTTVLHTLADAAPVVREWLPEGLRRRHRLPDLITALRQVHFPDTLDAHTAARRRFVYEELLLLELLLLRQKAAWEAEPRTILLPEVSPAPLTSTTSHLIGSLLSNLELRTGDLGRRVRQALRESSRRFVRRAKIERVSTGTQHFDLGAVQLGMSAASHLVLRNQNYAEIVERRRRNYFLLYAMLRDVAPPVTGELKPGVCPLFYPMAVEDKAGAMARLLARGVETVDFWRLRHPALPLGAFPEVDQLRETVLELPVHQDLSPADAEHVAVCTRELLA